MKRIAIALTAAALTGCASKTTQTVYRTPSGTMVKTATETSTATTTRTVYITPYGTLVKAERTRK